MAAMSAPIPPLGMKELRRWRGVTGQQIAIKIGIARCNAFAWQQRDVRHLHIETLRKYVEAMGGELRLVAVFGDGMARPALRAGRRPLMRTVGARQRGPALRVPGARCRSWAPGRSLLTKTRLRARCQQHVR
jgi:hypothetical protein